MVVPAVSPSTGGPKNPDRRSVSIPGLPGRLPPKPTCAHLVEEMDHDLCALDSSDIAGTSVPVLRQHEVRHVGRRDDKGHAMDAGLVPALHRGDGDPWGIRLD